MLARKLLSFDQAYRSLTPARQVTNDQVVTADEFMQKNAHWWATTPNETAHRMTRGGLHVLPTNFMTDYTLQGIGNDDTI